MDAVSLCNHDSFLNKSLFFVVVFEFTHICKNQYIQSSKNNFVPLRTLHLLENGNFPLGEAGVHSPPNALGTCLLLF